MRPWLRGTGRYLLAQVAQLWLWGLLYWVYLLLGCYVVSDADGGWGRTLLWAWVVANTAGFLVLRAIAHSARVGAADDRNAAVSAGDSLAEIGALAADIMLLNDDVPIEERNETLRRVLLAVCLVGLLAVYLVIGVFPFLMADALSRPPSGGPLLHTALAAAWASATFRIYAFAGVAWISHLLAHLLVRRVSERMERFSLGPFYQAYEQERLRMRSAR